MAQNDVLKKYLEAGLAFTALTQARAEALVKELVKAGEVQADQARDAVVDLVERSRQNSEKLLETVRSEVKSQITNLGLASKQDVERAERRIVDLITAATSGRARRSTPAEKTSAAKQPGKKKAAPAKKAPAKKKAAAKKKASAKKAPAKKSAAKKA